MADTKEIRFKFVVDQSSAREVNRVLDDMIARAEKLGKALQSGGGLLGGVKTGAGQPSPQSTLAGKGGSTTGQSTISKAVLENANAFKSFGKEGSTAMKGLTDSLRAGIKDQIAQIRTLEERLKVASSLYQNLKKDASAPAGAAEAANKTVLRTASAAQEAREQLDEMMEMRRKRPGAGVKGPHGGILPDVPYPDMDPGKWGGGEGDKVAAMARGEKPGGGGMASLLARGVRGAGYMAMAGTVAGGVTGIADAFVNNFTVKAKNDAARASLIAGMTERIIGGDFTDLGVLNQQRRVDGAASTEANDRAIDNIYQRSNAHKMADWTNRSINVPMGALGALAGSVGIGGGSFSAFGSNIAEMRYGGPQAAATQDMALAIQQAKEANPFFVRTMRDMQEKAAMRAQAHSLLGSKGVMGGLAAREEYAMMAAIGRDAGGLKEEETLALRGQLAAGVGSTMGNQLLGRAAGAERFHGVSQGVATQALTSLTLGSGSTSQAKAQWEEIMSKAFSAGIEDSKLKEALVEASTASMATSRGRLGDASGVFDLLSGNLNTGAAGGGMYGAQIAREGLAHNDQFWGSRGTGPLDTIKLMNARSVVAQMKKEGALPEGTNETAMVLALSRQTMTEQAAGGSEALKDVLGGGQAAANVATEAGMRLQKSTMESIIPQAVDNKLVEKFKKVGWKGLSKQDQSALTVMLSGTQGMQGEYATVRAAMEQQQAIQTGGGLAKAGEVVADTREKDTTDRRVMMAQAATSLDSLFRGFDEKTIAGIEAGTAASVKLLENLREFGDDKALQGSAGVIGEAATALRDVARAAQDVVNVANGLPVGYRSPTASGSSNSNEAPLPPPEQSDGGSP